jgi:hypothetical protein
MSLPRYRNKASIEARSYASAFESFRTSRISSMRGSHVRGVGTEPGVAGKGSDCFEDGHEVAAGTIAL